MTEDQIIDQIELVRHFNNVHWMAILRLALQSSPKETKDILGRINEGDKQISDLLGQLTK